MTQIMNASEVKKMTDGQIDDAVDKFRDALRKRRNEVPSEAAQQVLGVENVGMIMAAPFCERAEAVSERIIRRVKVNRARSPKEALVATGRAPYLNDEVVETMPRRTEDEVEMYFFPGKRFLTPTELDQEYERRGLVPDPQAQAAVNEDDPDFADKHPNGTQWRDENGKACFATFDHGDDERRVDCDRDGHGWDDDWWFGGVRK